MMKEDKHIRQVLLNSAEGTSINFTDLVLERINKLSVTRSGYQPLVSPKWQRVFLLTFAFIAVAIIILCVLLAYGPVDASRWIKNWEVPEIGYNKIIAFIVCFWIVFGLNVLFNKKVMHFRKAFNGKA